jgi:hypothetical protein
MLPKVLGRRVPTFEDVATFVFGCVSHRDGRKLNMNLSFDSKQVN